MPIQIIFLVMGFSGMYDDHTEWVAAALPSLEDATQYRAKALVAAREAIDAWKARPENRGMTYVYFEEPTKFDLNLTVRDGSVSYRIVPVPLLTGAVPASGLIGAADAFASAQGLAREVNYRGVSQMSGRPTPAPAVQVTSDFSEKLARVLAVSPAAA